jgi:hypothetical protein
MNVEISAICRIIPVCLHIKINNTDTAIIGNVRTSYLHLSSEHVYNGSIHFAGHISLYVACIDTVAKIMTVICSSYLCLFAKIQCHNAILLSNKRCLQGTYMYLFLICKDPT